MGKLVHVVDDDESFRRATARLLRTAGYEVAEHPTADHLLRSPPDDAEPACLVLDVRMPDLTGPELQERLAALGVSAPVVFLTGHGDIPMTVRAIKRGAEDFLTKPVDPDELINAIERAILRHRRMLAESGRNATLQVLAGKLTPRETEVFQHVARGRQNKQIAHELGTTVRTVKAHRRRVMEKLNATSLIEVVSIARKLGILNEER